MQNLYIFLFFYITLLFLISYIISKKQSKEDFLIGGRNRSGTQILFSKFASSIGAAWFITYTGFAYKYGMGVFALLVGTIIGYLLFAFWASPKIYSKSKEKKFYTIGDFVFDKTKNKTTLYLTNYLSKATILGWLIVGIIGGGKIIESFGFLPYNLSVILTSLVILVYLLMGGFKAVLITDVFQSLIIIFLLVIMTFSIVDFQNIQSLTVGNPEIDFGIALGFLLFGTLSVFSFSDRYQLCYASKNKKSLSKGLGVAIIPIILTAFLLLFIGNFMALNSPGLDTGLVFTEAMKQYLPQSILNLGIILFFAGIMSSADTSIYAIASHFVLTQKNHSLKKIKNTIIILVILITLIALKYSDIVDISIIAGGISLILSIPMIYILSGGKNHKKFIASNISGIFGFFIGLIILGISPLIAIPVLSSSSIPLFFKFKR
jgi:Na+/proline symporter